MADRVPTKILSSLKIKTEKIFLKLAKRYPGSKIYLVGGIVRDLLLGRENTDYDFVVVGINQKELAKFLEQHGEIVAESDVGTAVYKFLPRDDDRVIDIALPRRECYQPGGGRTPEVEVVSNIEEDLTRRDFTVNAMALKVDPARHCEESSTKQSINTKRLPRSARNDKILDPFHGLDDINKKIIRAVGDPRERFREDPLRILRAIRFACQLGFGIDAKTFTAIKDLKGELVKTYIDDGKKKLRVSKERFMKEFLQALDSDPLKFYDLYDQSGLFDILLPEINAMKDVEQPKNFHSEGDVFVHSRLALSNLDKTAPIEVKLATLLHDIGKPPTYNQKDGKIMFYEHDRKSAEMARDIFKRFPLPKAMADEVIWLIRNHMKPPYFKKMKRSKLLALGRNPYFNDLMAVILADTKASLRPGGKIQNDWLKETLKYQKIIETELKKKKPVEIINGHEIIDIIKKIDKDYDFQKGGKLVGYVKSQVNEAYDDEKIKTKKAALLLTSQIAKDKLK